MASQNKYRAASAPTLRRADRVIGDNRAVPGRRSSGEIDIRFHFKDSPDIKEGTAELGGAKRRALLVYVYIQCKGSAVPNIGAYADKIVFNMCQPKDSKTSS